MSNGGSDDNDCGSDHAGSGGKVYSVSNGGRGGTYIISYE